MIDDGQEIRNLHQANRKGWNEGAAAYWLDLEDQIEFLARGGKNFCPPELPHLSDLAEWCGRAVHLQCAGGTDTLSLYNAGAREVVGIDISDEMIAIANAKSQALNAPATWERCDVLDTPAEFDGTADLVYTGRGALCWIMDITKWATVASRLLKPGGRLYIFEGHPVSDLWCLEESTYILDPEYGNYFQERPIASSGWPDTYIGDLGKPQEQHAPKHERFWPLGKVVNAVIASGLQISKLEEHPDLYWNRFPTMPPDLVRRTPQTFSLLAHKPH